MKLAVTTAVIVAFAAGSAFAAGEKKGHSDGAAHGSTTYSATTTQTTTISPASYRGLSFNLQDTNAVDNGVVYSDFTETARPSEVQAVTGYTFNLN